MNATSDQKVLVFDFGAQYGQLIARRVRDLHVYSEIVPCDISADEIRALDPAAIILSGGPARHAVDPTRRQFTLSNHFPRISFISLSE